MFEFQAMLQNGCDNEDYFQANMINGKGQVLRRQKSHEYRKDPKAAGGGSAAGSMDRVDGGEEAARRRQAS